MLALRRGDSPGAVYEPFVVPVPALPAHAAGSALVTGAGADQVRLTAWVHGRVQGVGMRWWIRSRALELGLVGWARNTEDGRVEVVAEGEPEAAQRLLDLLRGAPQRPGRIDSVIERWGQASAGELSGFVER